MTSNNNYKDTPLHQANLTPILGKPTFEMFHKIRNNIKAIAKSVYSNLGGVAYGHLSLVLTDAHYALISPTPFIYPNHPGPIIIPDGTTFHANSNMRISHTNKVCLFQEVKGVVQTLVQQVFGMVEEAYLADIHNCMTNSINKTDADVLTHL